MQNILEDAKQIVCIVPKGMGQKLVEALAEKGIHNSNFSGARGVGRSVSLQDRGVGEQREKDVFSVTLDAARADEIFEFLFHEAEMKVPHNGLMYMQAVPKTTVLSIPELSEDEAT